MRKKKMKKILGYQAKIKYIEFNAHEHLTPWQRGFVASFKQQLGSKSKLSKDQEDYIDTIYEMARRQMYSNY